ncbi:MAG: 4-hydroxythreonine-4-phosphate dehydrogenase PdxA [Gammaproteobacteria bacterium]|nr:4-hydroxythreonine-4-phosphate dehydrogenase PdxA [Gammaproteobacteria bacterium]
MDTSLNRLLITPGEPAGIGPDITLKIAQKHFDAEIIVIADPVLLSQRAKLLGLDIKLNIIDKLDSALHKHQPDQLHVLPVQLATTSTPGILDSRNSGYVLECLEKAAQLCLHHKTSAMVTGPIHKGIINEAGIGFTGHTEFLAELSCSKPVMMLATESLRVALATTHLPLNKVSDAITKDSLIYNISTLHEFLLNRCDIEQPRILVCGLNPHAGEDGHLGMEEIEVIEPAIQHCKQNGMNITGPTPADTAFTTSSLDQADAVLAMYHDQGLPVLKHTGFGNAVNITLGLPFIRTSVDHGTALGLAGSGNANINSMLAAINMATTLRSN